MLDVRLEKALVENGGGHNEQQRQQGLVEDEEKLHDVRSTRPRLVGLQNMEGSGHQEPWGKDYKLEFSPIHWTRGRPLKFLSEVYRVATCIRAVA